MTASEWQKSCGEDDAVLQACINDLAFCEEERNVFRKAIQTRDTILDEFGNKLVAYRDRAEKAEARVKVLEEALLTMVNLVDAAQEDGVLIHVPDFVRAALAGKEDSGE